MMHIHIIAIGKLKERYLTEGMEEYAKRLRPYAKLDITEFPEAPVPVSPAPAEAALAKTREGGLLDNAIRQPSVVIVLDPAGAPWSSEELANRIKTWEISGENRLTFLIGGPLGLTDEIRSRADHVLSLSRMTFTHQMARLILMEQLYRAFRIARGEPYHK